jgi:hypothetical protein
MDSLLQECEGMVSERLSFNLGINYSDFGILNSLTPHQGVLPGRFDQEVERPECGVLDRP